MKIQEALGLFIPDITGLSALVGTRVYWIAGPPVDPDVPDLPAVTFRRTASPRLAWFLRGASQVPKYTVEVMALSEISPDEAQAIADCISAGMDGYVGAMGASGSPLSGGVNVKSCHLLDEVDMPWDEYGMFAVQQTYEITV